MAIQPQVSTSAAFALRGHSGARLTLIEDPIAAFVRKSATNPAQNARLTEQCRKLQSAHLSGIPSPAVYRTGEKDELFFFDMEFVPGETLAHAIVSGTDRRWNELVVQITGLLSRLAATSTQDIPESAFVGKLSAILEQCRANPFAAADVPAIERAIQRMLPLSWTGIPQSDCHGDLTLENMLIRQDNSLIFLDFDVPEHSSWQLDIGKTYQDVIGHWCLRHLAMAEPQSVDLLNAQMAMARTETAFAPIAAMVPGGRARLAQLASFHLCRTLPYARSPGIVSYVVKRIETLLANC